MGAFESSTICSVIIDPDFENRYPDSSAKATECTMNLVLTGELLEKRISQWQTLKHPCRPTKSLSI